MATLILEHPIKLSEKITITELKFKDRATGEDMLAFDTPSPNARLHKLIASLASVDEVVARKMDVVDYRKADAIIDKILFPDVKTEDSEEEASGKRGNDVTES